MKKAKVIFSTGVAHPLYKKEVVAIIETETGGYNRRGIFAKTIEPVHYDEVPEGILVFDKRGRIIRRETRPAYSEVWAGWVEKIVCYL